MAYLECKNDFGVEQVFVSYGSIFRESNGVLEYFQELSNYISYSY